jgi:predicted nucleic acid-binding protein
MRGLLPDRGPLRRTRPAHYDSQAGGVESERSGRLELADLSRSAVKRSSQRMRKNADLPMDLADATLVALAEERGQRRVFTLDADFGVYRLHGGQRFEIVPGPVSR